MKEVTGCFALVIFGIAMVIFGPAFYYFGGWITGHLLSWLIGDTIINGFNYLFNTTRFTVDNLPTMCGTIAVIGSFFKSTNYNSKKD